MTARPTIVCVDDDAPLLQGLREQILRGLARACDVELASSGTEALELLEELAADGVPVPLIICDQMMPGMSGADLLAQAHRLYPDILTIMLTGEADISAVSKAVNQARLYRLLTKPWREQDLVLTVKEALRRTQLDRELARRGAELNSANEHLERSLHMLQATMDATPDGLLVVGPDGLPLHANRRFGDIWSVPESRATGLPAHGLPGASLPGPGLLAHLSAQLVNPQQLTLRADGEPCRPTVLQCIGDRAVEFSGRPFLLQGRPAGAVYGFRDVTEREQHARQMRHQALHDSLSGLPNRLQFVQALDQALVEARAGADPLSVMFVDLDHFKRINDTLGHEAGDCLLKGASQRLAHCLRGSDMVARWGGDEFTVMLREDSRTRRGDPQLVAQRIVDALKQPFDFDGVALRVSASVGIASFPADGQTGDELLRRADMALYRAKECGRNGFQAYRDSDFAELEAKNELSLEADLMAAIEHGQLTLHYQPQVDIRSGAIRAVEALARWHHPVRGWIPPCSFIPIAERTGAIAMLGRWILQTACDQAAQWRRQGLGDIRIAVNLAPTQVMRCNLHAAVHEVLAASGLRPDLLELEVTEMTAMRNIEQVAGCLAALRADGVRIALDDFGTGYSSLTYLKQLPCDTLKIDRSFVLGAAQSARDAAIIRGLVTMAEAMELELVAEGIESQATAQALEAMGCHVMQGFHIGRPLPADELLVFLHQHHEMVTSDAGAAAESQMG